MKIKKGDTVLIISGKDQGKKGKILEVFPMEKRAVVENINMRKKTCEAEEIWRERPNHCSASSNPYF